MCNLEKNRSLYLTEPKPVWISSKWKDLFAFFPLPTKDLRICSSSNGIRGQKKKKNSYKGKQFRKMLQFYAESREPQKQKKLLTIPLIDEGLLWLTIKRHSSCIDNWHQIVRKIIPVSTTNISSGHVTATWIPSHILVSNSKLSIYHFIFLKIFWQSL